MENFRAKNKKSRVRFAPSPTGYLHVGNARIALLNKLFAEQLGGEFILRLDDSDPERSKEEYSKGILEDLAWLGLLPDALYRQSKRKELYREAVRTLQKEGFLYPAYETPEELEVKRSLALSRGRPPIYDRAALRLKDKEKRQLEAAGKKPHFRFKLQNRPVVWKDLARGEIHILPTHMSDPVLVREDGEPLYTLSSVVDDLDMGITHVIRGLDHVSNTAIQVQIYRALGGTVPEFAHFPLLEEESGRGFSKRNASFSLREFRWKGIPPEALAIYLTYLGTGERPSGRERWEDLVRFVSFDRYGTSKAVVRRETILDTAQLVFAHLPFEHVESWFQARDVKVGKGLWNLVRQNVRSLNDVVAWEALFADPKHFAVPDFSDDALHILREILSCLVEDYAWKDLLQSLKARGLSIGRPFYHTLRLALTGKLDGPELGEIYTFLGGDFVRARIQHITA